MTHEVNRVGESFLGGFDTNDYRRRNYAGVLPEDEPWIRGTVRQLAYGYKPYTTGLDRRIRRGMDVGNAGVPVGSGLTAPLIEDGGHISWFDVGPQQLEAARLMAIRGSTGELGGFAHHQQLMEDVNSRWRGAVQRACGMACIQQMSVFDLPRGIAEIGSMLFVAESITQKISEAEEAVRCFLRAITPGGIAIIGCMLGSTGYQTSGVSHPACPIDQVDMYHFTEGDLIGRSLAFTRASGKSREGDDTHEQSGVGVMIGIKN